MRRWKRTERSGGRRRVRTRRRGIEEIQTLAGRDLGTSAWRTETQDVIDTFAEVSGDHRWIHTDPVRAAAGPFGRTIAHGYTTLSWGISMLAKLLRVTCDGVQ